MVNDVRRARAVPLVPEYQLGERTGVLSSPTTLSRGFFVSAHGTRYPASGQWKTWNKLRIAAGCPNAQMDDIRDAAYTAACRAKGVDEKYARLLAGHRSHGLTDAYVQRNPFDVKPASDAVYAAFFG